MQFAGLDMKEKLETVLKDDKIQDQSIYYKPDPKINRQSLIRYQNDISVFSRELLTAKNHYLPFLREFMSKKLLISDEASIVTSDV